MLSLLARNGLSMLAGEPKTTRPALMGLRFGSQQVTKEVVATASHRGSIGDKEDNQPDVHKLTTNECWRLILKLGKPAWLSASVCVFRKKKCKNQNFCTLLENVSFVDFGCMHSWVRIGSRGYVKVYLGYVR
jgi:hypothetical protein